MLVMLVTFPQGSGFNKHSKVHRWRAFTSSALGNTASAGNKNKHHTLPRVIKDHQFFGGAA
jgi:hypothetical protein